MLQPFVKKLLTDTYNDNCYLWDDRMEDMISEFVASNPLTGDIRDKFKLYDMRSNDLKEANQVVRIDCLEIHMTDVFDGFVVYSKAWKTTMGKYLSALYKKKLLVFVDFISEMESIMKRKLKDLDDVRIAMDALDRIREESVT